MQRYRDYNRYLREIFGERVQKIPLDAGLGCPNRDGAISERGCIFCNLHGSGTGAWTDQGLSITAQVTRAKENISKRYKARKFIAYFQSFTNTYAPLSRLKSLYDEALKQSDMVGLSVATRPDCIDEKILDLLYSYQENHLVWLEYGLQSSHEKTLKRINRGHGVSDFIRSVRLTNDRNLNTCVHVILGLPGENRAMMMETARFLSRLPIQGVKIHLLYVIRGTELEAMYRNGGLRCLEREEYVDLVTGFLELLPPHIVVQRITGDPSGGELVAPLWAREKTDIIRLIREKLETEDRWQGRLFQRYQEGKQSLRREHPSPFQGS